MHSRTAVLVATEELCESLAVLAAFKRYPRASLQAEKLALASFSSPSFLVFSITSVLSNLPTSILVEAQHSAGLRTRKIVASLVL
jgi:hypothetical protein